MPLKFQTSSTIGPRQDSLDVTPEATSNRQPKEYTTPLPRPARDDDVMLSASLSPIPACIPTIGNFQYIYAMHQHSQAIMRGSSVSKCLSARQGSSARKLTSEARTLLLAPLSFRFELSFADVCAAEALQGCRTLFQVLRVQLVPDHTSLRN